MLSVPSLASKRPGTSKRHTPVLFYRLKRLTCLWKAGHHSRLCICVGATTLASIAKLKSPGDGYSDDDHSGRAFICSDPPGAGSSAKLADDMRSLFRVLNRANRTLGNAPVHRSP
jgi:hypothetical protein